MTKKNNNNKNDVTENMTKLLEQISEKDKKIFNLQKEMNELKNKINNDLDNKNTQNMLNSINEKELKNNINELQNIINEKDNELSELRTKYENLKYESTKFNSKAYYNEEGDDELNEGNNEMFINQLKEDNLKYESKKFNVKAYYNEGDDENNEGNNEVFINQLKEIQKTYKEREEKLINEKNEEIRKLKMRNKDLVRESVLDNSNIDINKYLNEINRLKNINNTLEEDLSYYKELNSRFVDNEKNATVYESENIKLKNLIQEKKDEIDEMHKKQKELIEQNKSLESQLVTSKGKLGEILNELAEYESKCVTLEEENKKMKKNMGSIANGGVNIIGKITGKKTEKK